MNTQQWAVFFVALLSVDYTAAFFFGNYGGVSKSYAGDNEGYYGWSGGCRCHEDLTSRLDKALGSVRGHLGRQKKYSLKDTNFEEYEFNNGHVRGLHEFERKGPYRCSLSRNYVRVYFRIGFFRLLINYSASLVEDILGGFLGGVASFIGDILGSITDFLFRIAVPDVYVTCVLRQRFDGRRGMELEGLYLNKIERISILNKRFSRHQGSFGSYITPVFDYALRHFFQEKFAVVFRRYISRVTARREHFYYDSSSRKEYRSYSGGRQYEETEETEESDESEESSGSYEYSYESSESTEE